MKKGYIRGVLTCDPSWRGLAFTIHVPSLDYNVSEVMDLAVLIKNQKTLTQPLSYIPLVVFAVETLIERRPLVRLCDKLIIESQFTESMKTLCHVVVAVVSSLLIGIKTEKLSALTCKRNNGVAYGESHHKNKINMLNYVTENKDKLIAGDTVKDHNTADSIILLNTWLNLKNRHFYSELEEYAMKYRKPIPRDVPFLEKNITWECPACMYHSGRIWMVKKAPEDGKVDRRGQFFMMCGNKNCKASTFWPKERGLPEMEGEYIGDIETGRWKRSDCTRPPPSSQPEENAQYPDSYNTIPVERLGSREEEPPINPLKDIVDALEQKQEKLQQTIVDMQKNTNDTLNKLFQAIAGAPLKTSDAAPPEVGEKRKLPEPEKTEQPPKKRTAVPRSKTNSMKFDVNGVDISEP